MKKWTPFLILFLVALSLLGSAMMASVPAALYPQISQALGWDRAQARAFQGWMYFTFYLPSCLTPLMLNGPFSTFEHFFSCFILLHIFHVLGSFLLGFGVQNQYALMVLCGRGVMGFAYEALLTVASRILSHWFQVLKTKTGTEQSLAIGFCQTLFRLSGAFSSIISPLLATFPSCTFEVITGTTQKGLVTAVWLGTLVGFAGLGLAFLGWILHTWQLSEKGHNHDTQISTTETSCLLYLLSRKKELKKPYQWFVGPVTSTHSFLIHEPDAAACHVKAASPISTFASKTLAPRLSPKLVQSPLSRTKYLGPSMRRTLSSSPSTQFFGQKNAYQVYIQPLVDSVSSASPCVTNLTDEHFELQAYWSLVPTFSSQFWLFLGAGLCFYTSIAHMGQITSMKRLESLKKTGWLLSIPDLVSCLLVPVLPMMSSHYDSKRMLFIPGVLLAICHLWLATPSFQVAGLVLLGLTEALFLVAFWTGIHKLVPEHAVLTAYTVVAVLLSLTLCIGSLVIPWLAWLDPTFMLLHATMAFSALIGLVLYCIYYSKININATCTTEDSLISPHPVPTLFLSWSEKLESVALAIPSPGTSYRSLTSQSYLTEEDEGYAGESEDCHRDDVCWSYHPSL